MRHALISALVLLAACGSSKTVVPDAGPDTSCGLDCAAQQRFGLIVNRCFEYADNVSTPGLAVLGAQVLPVLKLEGGVSVLPVEYRQYGQVKMRDSFLISNGSLYLARREVNSSGLSVTYRDDAKNIVGVKWLNSDTASGETYETPTSQAFVVDHTGIGTTEATDYKITTTDAVGTKLHTPLQTFDAGVELLIGETPDHSHDPRRVWVPDVGFIVLATPLAPTALSLQKIRDLGGPDAGADCSLGGP